MPSTVLDPVCIINTTHDFTHYVKMTGFEWEDNDIDADDSGRNELDPNLAMDRLVLGDKQKLKLTFTDMPFDKVHELCVILKAASSSNRNFSMKYLDPDAGAQVTKTFYCTKRSASIARRLADGTTVWSVKNVELVEV